MTNITLTQPDDWHLHLRDGTIMKSVVADTARVFARAIIMPNLSPPITTVTQALAYRQRIMKALPEKNSFQPLMTLYLTNQTTTDEIKKAANTSHIHAFKLYPAGATTNSKQGIADLETIYPALTAMQACNIPLLIHGEVTTESVDIFDREKVFIDECLAPIVQRFPALKIVLEHITTRNAMEFVASQSDRVAATITAHHLCLNRNAMLAGGIRPHYYCLPILKREKHRQALLQAATSGNPKFFLGTDSAPHLQSTKESACGCAGSYTAHSAMPLYTEVFAQQNALNKLEGFASHFGPDFYGLPRNLKTITLTRTPWKVPNDLTIEKERLIPFFAGKSLQWQITTS